MAGDGFRNGVFAETVLSFPTLDLSRYPDNNTFYCNDLKPQKAIKFAHLVTKLTESVRLIGVTVFGG